MLDERIKTIHYSCMVKGHKSFPLEEAFRFGWDTMKKNYFIFLSLFFIQIIFYILRIAINLMIRKQDYGASIAESVVFYIISSILSLGTYYVMLQLVKGKKTSPADLFTPLPFSLQYIAASLLHILIMVAGFILLIIPSIIWGIKFGYFGYIIAEKKVGPIEALKQSAAITKGNILSLFLFNAVCTIINIAGALCLVVGLFITIPMTMLASAYVYRKLASK